MSPDDSATVEERLADLLAACDDVLAAGLTPDLPDPAALPTEVRARLQRDLACMHLLRQMWPDDDTPAPAVATETPLLRSGS